MILTTCNQDAFPTLVSSLLTICQWLVDNLLHGCWQCYFLTSLPQVCWEHIFFKQKRSEIVHTLLQIFWISLSVGRESLIHQGSTTMVLIFSYNWLISIMKALHCAGRSVEKVMIAVQWTRIVFYARTTGVLRYCRGYFLHSLVYSFQ